MLPVIEISEDGLNTAAMNVKYGGKQPIMSDTVGGGKVQKMTLPDGTPKGLKRELQERGVDCSELNADKMREMLSKHKDF